jgi:hypothetical protein
VVVTIVLRLLPGPLAAGELVGHAEVVATGASASVRNVSDLLVLARDAARIVADPTARPDPDSSDGEPLAGAPAP